VDDSTRRLARGLQSVVTQPATGDDMDILVVDDSRATRESLIAFLQDRSADTSVREANSARVALTKIAETSPDVIVLDIQMDGPQGFSVLEAAKRMGTVAPVVIVFTSHATERYRKRAEWLGADYFFDKATGVRELMEAIDAVANGADH